MNNSVERTILDRRSIRRYTDRPVAREALERILNAAIWAPSAHNRQPWRFAVVTPFAQRRDLALAMGERLRGDLTRDNAPSEMIEKDVKRSYARITGAPVVFVVSLTLAEMDRYPDAKRSAAEHQMAVQSTAMAVQNMLLAAQAKALAAAWVFSPLFGPPSPAT